MTNDPEEHIRRSLLPGEAVAWLGRPKQGVVLRLSDWALLPLVVLMAAIVVTGMLKGLRAGHAGGPAGLGAGPLFLVALALVGFGRLWVDAGRRRRTAYAVTDRRVLIADAGARPPVWSAPLDRLRDVRLEEGFGPHGSVVFADFGDYDSFLLAGGNRPWVDMTGSPSVRRRVPPMFELVRDPRRAYAAIRDAAPRLTSP